MRIYTLFSARNELRKTIRGGTLQERTPILNICHYYDREDFAR